MRGGNEIEGRAGSYLNLMMQTVTHGYTDGASETSRNVIAIIK